MAEIQKEIEETMQQDAARFYAENFRIKREAYLLNTPQYEHQVTHTSLLAGTNTIRQQAKIREGTSYFDDFSKAKHWYMDEDNRADSSDSNNLQQKLNDLKQRYNSVIDSMYDEIATAIISTEVDKYLVPVHGIPFPEKENPVNLFKRQLRLEELSFELAHTKYTA